MSGHADHRRAARADEQSPRRKTRPMTGEEYIESLCDGREIYLYGERVRAVTSHPAFRNPARMIARLYDALHDPERSAVLVAPTDTGSDGYTHRFFTTPHSVEDLIADQKAIAEWARMTCQRSARSWMTNSRLTDRRCALPRSPRRSWRCGRRRRPSSTLSWCGLRGASARRA